MNLPSPIQQLSSSLIEEKQLKVYIKRDDLIHPVISGNKWRKLKYNIEKFRAGKHEKLLTFGGAYSNHIAATAKAGAELGIQTIGIIRGDELSSDSNTTLKNASKDGMELIFTSREEYNLRDEKYYHEELRRRHGNIWIVPEGGANYYGMLGCQEILKEIELEIDYMVTACGTGTTAAGLLLGSPKVVGVSALKGGGFLYDSVSSLLQSFNLPDIEDYMQRFELKEQYHFGGYAKYDEDLIEFIKSFESEHNIQLDQVYTAKMMYALMDMISKNEFSKDSTIVALHTGGLQGRKSIEKLLFL